MNKKKFAAVMSIAIIAVVIMCLFVPCSGLPKSRAQSIQWDGTGNRLLTQEESEWIAKQLEEVSFRINLSGTHTTHGKRIILFFDDREKQTVLYCLDDGMLYRGYAGKGGRTCAGSYSPVALSICSSLLLILYL